MMDAEKLIRDAVAKLVKQNENSSSGKQEAFEGLMSEISLALAEVVELMGRDQDGGIATAITAGLKAMRVEVSVAAPSVTVNPTINVSPTPISNHFHAPPQQAPIIHFIEKEATPQGKSVHEVAIKYEKGFPVSFTITKR